MYRLRNDSPGLTGKMKIFIYILLKLPIIPFCFQSYVFIDDPVHQVLTTCDLSLGIGQRHGLPPHGRILSGTHRPAFIHQAHVGGVEGHQGRVCGVQGPGVGMRWWSAGAAEIEVKQISTLSGSSRFLAHLACNGGCLEYTMQLLDGREWL